MKNEQLLAMAGRIKQLREHTGLTQEQFAETIELSASSYTKIENAFQKPALDTLIKIADRLEVTLDYLVYGDKKPQRSVDKTVAGAVFSFADADKLLHAREVLDMIIHAKTK